MTKSGPVGRLVLLAGLVPLLVQGLGIEARADFSTGLAAYDAGDYEAALRSWRPLARAGDPEAQVALASLYADGLGVPRDPNKALRWYRRAAEQGDSVGQLNLGDLLAEGDGIPRDLVRAYLWFSLAAAQGRDWPARRLEEVRAQMTVDQLAEAERLIERRRIGEP